MTAYDLSLVNGQTLTFNAASDSLSIPGVDGGDVTITVSGSDLVVTDTVNNRSVTLASTTLAALGTNNLTFDSGKGKIYIGDNDDGTAVDAAPNTVVNSATDHKDNLVYGLGGGDTITLGNGDNMIFGGASTNDSTDGADSITVGTGSNTIYANAGNDTVKSGAVAAGETLTVYGGLGNDSITDNGTVPVGTVVAIGGTGADTIDFDGGGAATGNVTIRGGNANADSSDSADNIAIGDQGGVIYGNAGNDSITGDDLPSNSTIAVYGGLGNDTVTFDDGTGEFTIYGNTGADSITLGNAATGDATIFGGNGTSDSTDGADTINWGQGDGVIYGNAGNDSIRFQYVLAGTDEAVSVYGGLGNDTIDVDANSHDGAAFTFTLGDGDDVLILDATSLTGTATSFTITDFNADDDIAQITIDGGASASALTVSNGGVAPVITSTGQDQYIFQNFTGNFNTTNFVLSDGSDLITNFGGAAATLTGGTTNDQLLAGANGDKLVGGNGNDKLTGGAGNDTLASASTDQTTNDTIDGGAGTNVLLLTGGNTAGAQADATLTNVTNVQTLAFDDANYTFAGGQLTLGAQAQEAGIVTVDATALTGTNLVDITAAAYTVSIAFDGGNGNDIFTGGTVANDLDGNAGNDNLTGGAAADTIVGDAGADTLTGAAGDDSIDGGEDNDVIDGGTGLNTLSGGSGADDIQGGSLVDSITGGTGADTITGQGGADIIDAGAEADSITAGAGDDSITGGTGIDTYVFADDSTNGIDTIVMEAGDVDGSAIDDLFDFTANSAFIGTTTEDIVIVNDVNLSSGDTLGAAGDNIIILTGQFFADDTALAAATTTDLVNLSTGDAIVIYSSSSSADARVAVVSIAASGDITAAEDVAILTGLTVTEASTGFSNASFVLD